MNDISPVSGDTASCLVNEQEEKKYWGKFYSSKRTETVATPSQFAVFVLGEISNLDFVADIGAGNGRDSLFFARQGKHVIGVDQAQSAIDLCRAHAEQQDLDNAGFLCSDVSDASLADRIIERRNVSSAAVYARFFLHAINEEKEDIFLRSAVKICGPEGLLAVEFRTIRDASLSKVTGSHYRRFMEPLKFLTAAKSHGFEPLYFVEGFGYAKYKADDAHVARFILANRSG